MKSFCRAAHCLLIFVATGLCAALSTKTGGPAFDLALDNVRARAYPMYADVFFFMDRTPNKPVDPKLKEFLRFILSREGQELVMKDGKYLPLAAEVVREQLKKLH